jgi:hypothetical protein
VPIAFCGALLSSTTALSSWFHGDIAKMGAVTSLIYAGGLLLVPFIPTGSEERGSKTPEDSALKAAARSDVS